MDAETVAAMLLLKDEEEADMLQLLSSTRNETNVLYKSRTDEGYYRILIESQLNADDEKFRGFLRLNKNQFDFVLSLIHDDLNKQSTNRVKILVSQRGKLALTLR
ncbi:hypothetical protein HHI36_017038 [Cryptolaemus montrouzieri]|uniref:Uncharacterized protein n=1 Tax=Cryptolaemus montrouzieri TaxID=559131 RepID=A0ABD2NLV0_9CUCU